MIITVVICLLQDQCDSSASNGQVMNSGVPATGVNGGPHNEEKRPKLS